MSTLIPTDQLRHHPDNPTGRHDDVAELAVSIRSVGLLQPLLVEPDGDGYVVVAGNRRLAAARLIGLANVACTVRAAHDTDDHTAVRLIENGHRKNLTPLEQARAFAALRDAGMTLADIGERTGFSGAHVCNRLALLDLGEATQQLVESGVLSAADALQAIRVARGTARTATPPKNPSRTGHLGKKHPLAKTATERCKQQHGVYGGGRIGMVACGACWEFVIRADERWQIEEGDPPTDADSDVDEVAVERALAGARIRLSSAERDEVRRRQRVGAA